MKPLNVSIIGGGMITYDLILPSLYHLQRTGVVGSIAVCALNTPPLKALKESAVFQQAFPGQDFTPCPSLSEAQDRNFPDLFKEVISAMQPRQLVVVAIPDQMHYMVVKEALGHDQHILCVKPLVLKYEQAVEIEKLAMKKGLFVGIEYHKRFDRRSLIARRHYQLGHFGSFALGEAKLIEPYFYRNSNFQNWFTTDKTDPFVYIGCHYVDLIYFITGLKPVEVSLAGVKGKFPNGNEGFLWASGRVRFENGALLSVINGLGYPDDAAGSNDQGLTMFCEGDGKSGMIQHNDQFRGVSHGYLEGIGCAGSRYNYVNPDFFQLVPWEDSGYKPVGYGYDSVAAIVSTACGIERETSGLKGEEALLKRRDLIKAIDAKGLIATPANSYINELVVEAARLSIMHDGEPAIISYKPKVHAALRNHVK